LPSAAPLGKEQIRKVLIYRLGSLGDTVVAVPCLRLIAETFPNAERRLLTNFPVSAKASASAAVIGSSGLVHGYMRYTVGTRRPVELLRLAAQIREFRPDLLVYIPHIRPWKTVVRDRRFFRLAGARRIVGIANEALQRHQFDPSTGFHETEAARLGRLIEEIGDARVSDLKNWSLALTDEERGVGAEAVASVGNRPLIVCGPGTKMQAKDWGQENWSALLTRLNSEYPDHALALIGTQEEAGLSAIAAEGWAGPKVNLCGRLTPRETAAVIERARVFLGPDSGPMHLAACVGVPCVIAFSAAGTPGAWFPAGPHHQVVYHRTSCYHCQLETCTLEGRRCLSSITVDEMAAAVARVLAPEKTATRFPVYLAPGAEQKQALAAAANGFPPVEIKRTQSWSDPVAPLLARADRTVRRVLIYRLGSLGDTVVALPSFRLIAGMYPNAERVLLANFPVAAKAPASAAVLGASGLVHGYMRYTVGTRSPGELLRLNREIRRFRPDLLVYLMPPRPLKDVKRDALYFRLAGVKRFIGLPGEDELKYRFDAANGLYESEADRLARAIRSLGDAHPEELANWDPVLTQEEKATALNALRPVAGMPILVCAPGCKMQANDWEQHNWRALLARLAPRYSDHALVLAGAQQDAEACDLVSQEWAGPRLNLAGKLTPRESAAVFAHARIFIGADSGPKHLAACMGVPCVCVFSARDLPGVWFPPGSHNAIVHHQPECAGCGLETCIVMEKKCIRSVTVDEMEQAVERVMSWTVHTV
jgi:heptosyltransferase III